MAILASTVLTNARDRHPAFSKERITNAVLLRSLNEYQRQLLSRALLRDKHYLCQQASIVFSTQSASGAGVGGFPADVANDGTVSRAEQPVGYLKELETGDAVILVAEFVPSSSTTTSITKTAAGWTTDQYVGAYVEVVAGTGIQERRVITGNTSTTVSWATALTVPLDTTSVVRIISIASSVPEDMSVVTTIPTTQDRVGYLIKLDSSGVAYIDLTDPLTATFDRGIPLPPFKVLLGGTVRYADNQWPDELTLVAASQRNDAMGSYSAYLQGRELYLIGVATDWQNVQSIDLRYVPEPPSLTTLTDYFLLPDHAEPALVAHAAYVAGGRVQGLEGMPTVDMAMLAEERASAERTFLNEITAQKQQAVQRIAERW